MYRHPTSPLKSILIDGLRASLKRAGFLLNCLVVLSFMASPFAALPARAAGTITQESLMDQAAQSPGQVGSLSSEPNPPVPELQETVTVTNTESVEETAIPNPLPVDSPPESVEVSPSPDPSLDIGTTTPVSETYVEVDPPLESDDSSLTYAEEITPTLKVEKPSLIETGGGQAIGMGGKVSLNVPQGAAQQTLEVFIRPPVSLPLSVRSPSGEPFEIVAYRQDTREEVTQFDRPLTIDLVYDESLLRGNENTLQMVYYDEQKDAWEPLPTTVDVENNVIHAETNHLTVFDTTYADWEGSMLPSLKDFQVAPFTGASTYSLPIWTPPGPGGLQPSLELRYNSQMIDNSIAERTQASWVGMGWSLDTGYIERNMKGTPYDWEDDTFSISVGGVDSLLLKESDDYYHTADESFWRIQKVDATDSWIAWDKTGNTYVFGDNDNTRSMYKTNFVCIEDPDIHCTVYTGAWRWSLHKIRNAWGKELTFNYFEDTQQKRQKGGSKYYYYWADMWTYPHEIVYPNGHYKVHFETELRNDYDDSWDDNAYNMLYQKYRLKEISILNDGQIMRRYNFSYTTSNYVYPNVTWDKGGKTLTLASVQEYGKGGTSSLPATTFTYNSSHLVEANNGYGGKVSFAYDTQPWYELETIKEKAYNSTGCQEQPGGEWTTNFYSYPGEGHVECDEIVSPELHGKGYLAAPADLFQPGATYRLQATVSNSRSTSSITVRLGYNDGFQRVVLQEMVVKFRQTKTLSVYATPPANASLVHLYLECTNDCSLGAKLELMTTRYRVKQKGIYDGVQASPRVFQYRYDEPATNDTLHSAAAATDHPYIKPTTEFRGHAITQEVGPDGRVEWRFFHQDDQRKGRSTIDIVGSEEFQDDFSSGSANPTFWTSCYGTYSACLVANLRGDRAFDLQGGSSWGHIHRQNYTLEDGDMALTQFLVNGSSTQSMLLLVSASGMAWGAKVRADGTLGVLYNDGSGDHEVAFSPAITFKRDAWYVLQLVVDNDQKFLARVWERDNPSNVGEFRYVMPSGLSWQFRLYSLNGTTWLDTYSEGRIYKMSEQIYTVRTWATTSQPKGQIGPLPRDVGYFTGLGISWADVQHQKSLDFEGDGEYAGKRASYEYDDYGNEKRKLDTEWDAAAAAWRDYRLSVTGFYPNTNGVYLVGLPGFTNNYHCPANAFNGTCSSSYPSYPPAELVESSEWYLYDGHSGFSDLPTAGVLTGKRTALVKTSTETYYLDEDYVYDSWGNRTQTNVYKTPGTFYARQTANPLTTTQVYDPVYHTFVVNETNALGQPISFGYNYDLGLPVSMTGPNGVDTTITVGYDDFGRLTDVVRPGDSSPTSTLMVTYTYNATAPKLWIDLKQLIEVKDHVAQYASWRKVYNGLGLLIQAQTADAELQEGVRDILVDYTYDTYGNVVTQTVPYTITPWNGSGNPYRPQSGNAYSRTDYDLLNRPVRVRAPDQALTKYRYSDRESWVTDPMSNTTHTIFDAWGRTKQVIPELPPSVSYFYDAMDRLVGVSRGGISTAIAYDMGGRKTSMSDPDMGAWSYAYDALDNLTRQTDARGQRVCLYYDNINRLVGKYYQSIDECPSAPSYQVGFGYDQAAEGYYNVGHRTVMTDNTGVTHWLYDERGQLEREERQMTGQGLFVTEWGYNSAGQAAWMKYPRSNDGQTEEQVSYAYQNQLTLNSVEGLEKYVYGTSYDAAGRMVQQVLGNQILVNGYAYYPWAQQGGRLHQMTSGTPGDLTSLQNLQYSYDLVGNVLSIQDYKMGVDVNTPQTQSFAYDDLYRLLSAQSSGGLNSVGDYDESFGSGFGYTYDPNTGNLSGKAGLSYTYGDPSHAHAVTSLSNGFSYQYDANGNMTQRNLGSEVFNLAYDQENHLVQVSGTVTATYGYDGDGKRVLSTEEGITTTVYIGNYFEMSVSGGVTNTVTYYYAGSERVAMRQNDGAVKWLLGDHLGSTSLVYDGSETIRQGYKAWGERCYILGGEELPTTFRYTGQREEDSIGLYYYGARWYDPVLGRFIQVDTIKPNLYNVDAWDLYAYSLNNPIKYIDPDGHFAVPGLFEFMTFVVFVGLVVLATAALIVYYANDGPETVQETIVEGVEAVSEQIDSTVEGLTNLYESLESFGKLTSIEKYFSRKSEQELIDRLVKKYKLTKEQRRALHDSISKQHMSDEEIEDEAEELARLTKRFARDVFLDKKWQKTTEQNQEKSEENNKEKQRRR